MKKYFKNNKKDELFIEQKIISLEKDYDFILENNCNIKLYFINYGATDKNFNINFNLAGNNSKLEASFVHLGGKTENQQFNFTVNHCGKNCFSRLNIRRVQFGSSESFCRAMIKIDKNGSGTDAYLSDKSLLVGDNAKAESIPSLEILTNDVKASHGATVGRLSNEDIFYLRSRGLSAKQASQILIAGFINAILPPNALVQKSISAKLKSYV